jgi:hypothetical protein
MPKYIDGKLLSIITYEDDKPIAEEKEFLEACAKYDIVEFTNISYNHPIDSLPSNIKFINISLCRDFNHVLYNLPAGLIGLSLPGNYDKPLNYLPNGLQFLYFATRKSKQIANIYEDPPPQLKYLCVASWCYDLQDRLNYNYESFYGNSLYRHKLFLEAIK